jgi:hypothetical protein
VILTDRFTENLTQTNKEAESLLSANLETRSAGPKEKRDWGTIWERLINLGLGELAIKAGTGLSLVVLALLVVWVMGKFYLQGEPQNIVENSPVLAAPLPSPTPIMIAPEFEFAVGGAFREGIIRLAQIHTNMPTRPRFEVAKYTVQTGDTIFSIAEKFNLRPQTILWGNYMVLLDNPSMLQPGMELTILPVDGVYYEWHAGDGLNGVSEYFGVTPEEIINFEGNQLSMDTIGDFANPNITPGTWLIVPGGEREYITWSAPRITRDDPAVAKIFGAGACGSVSDGPVGNGYFIWPTTSHAVTGYDFTPETNHFGIDIGGPVGTPIFAVDNGVVVYAGWNDRGYGNVVVVDHGGGWQSLYAHLDALNVVCGSYLYQGDTLGWMGSTGNSTGPHLHFELRSDVYGRANPHNFLP